MSKIGNIFSSDDKLYLLKDKIYSIANEEIVLEDFEEFMSSFLHSSDDQQVLHEIYHAVQHFDSDILTVESNEKIIMKKKLKIIADNLDIRNRCELQRLLGDFFNNPYEY